jgi:arylsulfatase A-like enzyme
VTLKKNSVFFFLLFALLAACGKEQRSGFRLYRFIDELRSKNILKSPFLEGGEPGRPEPNSPPKSSPLLDLGSRENPYNLKKKVRIEGIEINILFAPAPSVYVYEPTIGAGGTIEFGVGVAPQENPQSPAVENSPEEKGVEFRVTLEKDGHREVLFRKLVTPPSPGEDLFSLHSIDVSEPGRGARLILETEGEGEFPAFWFNPILYTRARKTRAVVLVSVDTLRPDHLGCYGYERKTSPALDALAEEGAVFSNTYVSSPWTLPSHVSLLTSLHGIRHQVYYEDDKMAPDQITLADVLRAQGFMTSAFTDGGFLSRVYGFSKGFDYYEERKDGVLLHNSAELIRRQAGEWLEANRDKNFFLFLHTYQPHDPYACPHPYSTMFLEDDPVWRSLNLMGYLGGYAGIYRELAEKERQNIIGLYDGEVRYTDEALVGPLIAKLKELDLYDSALVIFTSDHGEEFFDHRSWAHGHTLYDEALKVPLIIKFPGGRFKGQRLDPIVRLVDIMPTILEETGIEQDGLEMDGRSLFPILRGKERGDRTFLADVGDNVLESHTGRKIAMNSGKSKLILNKPYGPGELAFFISPPPIVPAVELYDLAEDPGEKRNVVGERTAAARELNGRIVDIYRKSGGRKAAKIELDEALKERLRALGYIR